MKLFNAFEKEQIINIIKEYTENNKNWIRNCLDIAGVHTKIISPEKKNNLPDKENKYDKTRSKYLKWIWLFGISANLITKYYEPFIDYSIFAFIILIIATADTIHYLRDKYYAPEFDTFKGFENNPIAKSLWLISTSIIISASIIAGAGAITFTNNGSNSIQKPEINLLFEGETAKSDSSYIKIEPVQQTED